MGGGYLTARSSIVPAVLRGTAAILCAALLAACGGDDGDDVGDTRADQARQVARDAGLPTVVQDVLATAASSATATFTVRYRLAVEGSTTIVQDPPRRRIELVLGEGKTATRRVTITNDDGTFACTRAAEVWTCRKTADTSTDFGPLAVGDIQRTTEDLAAARKAYAFRVESRTIAKTRARCLVTELRPGQTPDPSRGARGVLCISPEGVPLLIEGAQSTVTATSYRPEADDRSFELPAKAS
jgi:hypothetical protein